MILKAAGIMAFQVGIHRLRTQFTSEKDVNNHFILIAIDS
jgi:hypothetical protein